MERGPVATSLSASVIYAGSALAYSGASLPIPGGIAVARVWSAILPLTPYVTRELHQATSLAREIQSERSLGLVTQG